MYHGKQCIQRCRPYSSCELKLKHIISYHKENYHSNIDNELTNYCISEVAYSIYKFWLKNINNEVKGTSSDLRNYIVSSLKYKAVLMTEIQTENENVRQCLEYLCEKLNNVVTMQLSLNTLLYFVHYSVLYSFHFYSLQDSNFVHTVTVCLVSIVSNAKK